MSARRHVATNRYIYIYIYIFIYIVGYRCLIIHVPYKRKHVLMNTDLQTSCIQMLFALKTPTNTKAYTWFSYSVDGSSRFLRNGVVSCQSARCHKLRHCMPVHSYVCKPAYLGHLIYKNWRDLFRDAYIYPYIHVIHKYLRHSFIIPQSVLRPVHSPFQSKFCT